jgi:ATP-dependent DNA helicase PIF1
VYYSADSIDKSEINDAQFDMIPPEYLNSLKTSDIADHKFTLKVGTPIMLLRDLDPSEGFLNGTRLIVTRLGQFVLQAQIMSGKNAGNMILIPRIPMSPSRSPWPFKLVRRQFPISASYAMPLDKPQGQSLDSVGLYLPKSVISRDQVKVAFSSVKSKDGLKILIHDKDDKAMSSTINAVFKEVFGNL